MAKSFKETLETLNKETMVYMGTKGGSSWVEINTAGTILDHLEDLENLMHRRVKTQYERAHQQIEKIPFTIVKVRNQLNDKNAETITVQIRNLENEFYNAYKLKEKTSKMLSGWISIGNRKVVDRYKHTSEPGVCIVVEGQDAGTLWLANEGPILKTKDI